jgi:hypothetical protein
MSDRITGPPDMLVNRIRKLDHKSARRALLYLLGWQIEDNDHSSLEEAINFAERQSTLQRGLSDE